MPQWRDGRIKQALIARTLALRRAVPALFAEGSYEPLDVRGEFTRTASLPLRADLNEDCRRDRSAPGLTVSAQRG